MRLPTASEINPFNDLDGQSAETNFLNKTAEEAYELFREKFMSYQEGLIWMGPVAFRFYIEPAIRYIQSEAATGDFAVPICFARVVEDRLKHEPAEIAPVAARLAEACGYIYEHWAEFGMSPDDDRKRYKALQMKLSAL